MRACGRVDPLFTAADPVCYGRRLGRLRPGTPLPLGQTRIVTPAAAGSSARAGRSRKTGQAMSSGSPGREAPARRYTHNGDDVYCHP